MSGPERQHIVDAFRFELGKVDRPDIRERVLDELNHVDHDLARLVAEGLGLRVPRARKQSSHDRRSPALSQAGQPTEPTTRKIAVLAADGVDAASLAPVLSALRKQGAICEVLAPHDGMLQTAEGGELAVDRGLVTMASVLYDAVLIAGGSASVETLLGNGDAVHYVTEAFKHAKPIGAIGQGTRLLEPLPNATDPPGVTTTPTDKTSSFARRFLETLATHRHFDRDVTAVPS